MNIKNTSIWPCSYILKKEFMDMVIEVTSNHVHMIQKRSKKKAQEYNAKKQFIYKNNREKFKTMVKDFKEFDQKFWEKRRLANRKIIGEKY